jgi:SAM-dependent methyltransferase
MNQHLNQFWSFWREEGDQWHHRNINAPMEQAVIDPIIKLDLPRKPVIVEIGCGNGRYIGRLQKAFQAKAIGLDPSELAIEAAREAWPDVEFHRTSAYAIDLFPADLIIFGFCLYVVDREYLFRVVSRTDKALKEGGYIAIHDFDPPEPTMVPYHHMEGVYTYKMDYSRLWLANPAYSLWSKTITRREEAVTIIQKGTWDKWQ